MSDNEITDAELVDTLRRLDLNPRRSGGQWMARCPAHEDRLPSLSACVRDGRLLLFCHAGCPFKAVLIALGLAGRSSPSKPVERGPRPPIQPSGSIATDWNTILQSNPPDEPTEHERRLGIPLGGLVRLGAVWAAGIGALAAPMYGELHGPLIGVRLRADDGRKWAVRGSHNGLFCPQTLTGEGPLYLPEGMTDTAAMLGLGLDAIGRPSCTGGRDLCRSLVNGRPMVVVSDGDAPGRAGAEMLGGELKSAGADVRILPPPPGIKDVREWITKGASRGTIEYAARHRAAL